MASLMALWMWSACGSSTTLPQVTLFPQQGGPVRVSVEIANTEEKRQFGLMYRTDLPEMQGMLFLFPREELLSFWMKNTPRSLDIIYINSAHTIVSIARNTTPFSEEHFPQENRRSLCSKSTQGSVRGMGSLKETGSSFLKTSLQFDDRQLGGADYALARSTSSTIFSSSTFSSTPLAFNPSVSMVVQNGHETATTSGFVSNAWATRN